MDNRKECKYGSKCYQVNEEHHKKYKHSYKKRQSDEPCNNKEIKKIKLSDNSTNSDRDTPNNEITNLNDIKQEEKPKDKKIEAENIVKAQKENLINQIINIEDQNVEECQKFIKSKFLVSMPDDFFQFWEFCKSISNKKPKDALESCGLYLAGPFDVLAGHFNGIDLNKFTPEQYLCHWRYFYDPAEFQTILIGNKKFEQHLGYFRDDPKEIPCFVAENESAKDCIIKPIGPNIFSAVNMIINRLSKKTDPFKKMAQNRIQKKLQDWAAEHNISLEESSSLMLKRKRLVVSRTFHQAGIVVPVNKETELGYRPLMETEKKLREMLTKIKNATTPEEKTARFNDLQMLLTATNIAIDECDFGTGLELGINLFSFGCEDLNETSLQFLTNSYNLLQREEFSQISKAHINNRKKGSLLSIFD